MIQKRSRYVILIALILVCLLSEMYRLYRRISHVLNPRHSALS